MVGAGHWKLFLTRFVSFCQCSTDILAISFLNYILENCEPKVGNELNNLKETNYNSYLAIQKFTMDFEDERLGAESFCTLLIASLDDEISTCCQFKGLGKLKIYLIP